MKQKLQSRKKKFTAQQLWYKIITMFAVMKQFKVYNWRWCSSLNEAVNHAVI